MKSKKSKGQGVPMILVYLIIMLVISFIFFTILGQTSEKGNSIFDIFGNKLEKIRIIDKEFQLDGSDLKYELKLQNVYEGLDAEPISPIIFLSIDNNIYGLKIGEAIKPRETVETSGVVPLSSFIESCNDFCKSQGYKTGMCKRESGKEAIGCLPNEYRAINIEECSTQQTCCCAGEKIEAYIEKIITITIWDTKKCPFATSDVKEITDLKKECQKYQIGADSYKLSSD